MRTIKKRSNSERYKSNGIGKSKNLTRNCAILTLVLLTGVIIDLFVQSGYIILFALIPSSVYQIIRTTGKFTKLSSWALLLSIITLIALVLFNVHFDISQYLNSGYQQVSGYTIPLGDLQMVLPILIIVFAIALMMRTAGPYTKWLSLNIITGTFGAFYFISPGGFPEMMRWAFNELLYLIN